MLQVTTLHERGELEEAREDTPGLARAYLDAVQKRKDAMSIMTAEFAASHPEHLEELNRERSLEEMERMLGLRGELDSTEDP